eukprot:7950078-Alexandrium_andersonii.AAC.1
MYPQSRGSRAREARRRGAGPHHGDLEGGHGEEEHPDLWGEAGSHDRQDREGARPPLVQPRLKRVATTG